MRRLPRRPVIADLLARAAALEDAFAADLGRPAVGPIAPERPIAFFCAEYGVHHSLPVYSGGLGALAGDLVKEASDQAVPLVAVGLLYRQGYFRQRLDASGWQQEYWVDIDPERLPMALVRAPDGETLTITVPIGGSEVRAQVWRVAVGRVPLFLLDADRPENGLLERWITSQLYVADPVTRLSQYVLLGVGGLRALTAMGIDPALVHLNEGHAAFAVLELARAEAARGRSVDAALQAARQRTVFTTHTPVAAGNETYARDDVIDTLGGVAAELGVDPDAIVRLGRQDPEDSAEPFGVTQFSLRMCRTANAVSRRHEGVAREMWRGLWPERALEAVPITHVTNGVHFATWVGPAMHRLLDRYLGEDWWRRASDVATWERLDEVSDSELWEARCEQRADLVAFVKERSGIDRLAERQPRALIESAARAFDPDALTIGFARRNATYKRIGLLVHDPGRAIALLSGPAPVQFVLAGKAHPADEEAKRVVQDLIRIKDVPQVSEHAVYLHDYDLAHGQAAGTGLRRLAQPAQAATGGERHERHEGRHQRWPEPERAGRLVGGGVRRHERLGAPGRGSARRRDAGRARRGHALPAAPATRSCRPSMTATRKGCRGPGSDGSAPRCGRWPRPSPPDGCSTTISSGYAPKKPLT